MRARRIDGSAIVVVGATSGVGRAIALSLASDAVGVSADIAVAAEVDRVLAVAVGRYGAVDTWINAAAGLLVGPLDDQPVADIERIIATNVLGTTLTSRAAMRHFHERDAGVLINLSSLLGVIPNPVVPTYVMTKFAVRGLTLSLHQSTWPRGRIKVCVVLPGPIDTPMFATAANYSGRPIRAIPPAFSPERVAAAVIRSVRRPRRQRTTGVTGALIAIGMHVVPRFTETVVAQIAARLIFRAGTAPEGSGQLFTARHAAGSSGRWRRSTRRTALGDAVGRTLARLGRA